MPTAGQLDYRLGEPQFRRFEPVLAQAIKAWPAVSSFPPPEGMALSTFVARFRDVLIAYRQNRWPSELFTYEQFSVLDEASVIRLDGTRGVAVFDHKRKQGRPPLAVSGTTNATPTSLGYLGPYTLTEPEQHAVCLLLNNNRLPGATFALTHPLSIDTSQYPNMAEAPHTGGLTLLF